MVLLGRKTSWGLISFIIFQLLDVVSPRPRGVAVFSGGRGGEGKVATVSDQWGVLSPTTRVLVGIYILIIAILVAVGIYRFYKWCHKSPP
ncbi:uncharacterized protein TNIN_215781 [Trichonephila inaurata madagascariensis]|uniref:Uncharacterized protein n=1 Tax=Trichonephila inaurata madagascariensis TaxID=2747483 RepID=A0A8X6Y3R6_9ARAC|nr:uncharacterized protein TNIN_215781 [Trichonephila inaurata madagascariensis]